MSLHDPSHDDLGWLASVPLWRLLVALILRR